jgi:hypothetical protein
VHRPVGHILYRRVDNNVGLGVPHDVVDLFSSSSYEQANHALGDQDCERMIFEAVPLVIMKRCLEDRLERVMLGAIAVVLNFYDRACQPRDHMVMVEFDACDAELVLDSLDRTLVVLAQILNILTIQKNFEVEDHLHTLRAFLTVRSLSSFTGVVVVFVAMTRSRPRARDKSDREGGCHTLSYRVDHDDCLDVSIFRDRACDGRVWDCGNLWNVSRNDAVVESGYRVLSWAFFKYIRIKCLKDGQTNLGFAARL